MQRRALALLAPLAASTLLACNAIIGLGQPTVNDDSGATLEGGEPSESGDESEASPGQDADASPTKDAPNGQGDGAPDADVFAVDAPDDASDAGDSTLGSDSPPPGDATMATFPLVYLVNGTDIPGIEICFGAGNDPSGMDTQLGPVLPYPQHQLGECVPLTCADQNIACGYASDGCGGLLSCGPCESDGSACVPLSCAQQGYACGFAGDRCGNAIQCGSCPPPQTCVAGQCEVPESGGGLLPGTGQPGPSMNGYQNSYVTPFVIPASRVPPHVTCDALLGPLGQGGMLAPGTFYRSATLTSGVFESNTTTLLAFWDCPPAMPNTGGGPCGMANLEAGVLAASVTSVPTTPMVSSNELALIGVNAAPGLDCIVAGCPMMPHMVEMFWPDGGGTLPPLMLDAPPVPQFNVSGFQQDASGAMLQDPLFQWQGSFDDIARASNDASTTTANGSPYFSDGMTYFLVLVGNPLISPDASANEAFHMIGAPISFQPDPLP